MNDFEEFNVTPELTLDPFQEEKKETPQILSLIHIDVYKRQSLDRP